MDRSDGRRGPLTAGPETVTASQEPRGFKAPGTSFMVSGGLVGAVAAYAFQAYGGRVLGEDAFAPVGLLWTAFFILATVLLVPLEQYVTREVTRGKRSLPGDLRTSLILALFGSVLGVAFVLLTPIFEGDFSYVAQIILLMVGYSLLFLGKGVLAGSRRFGDVGWVLIVESVVRLAAGIGLLALVASAVSMGWAMVIGGFSVLALRWWRHDQGVSEHEPAPVGRFLGGYVGGTASSQLLLGGAPIAVTAVGGSAALVSVIFATFTLFRAPLTLIFALQGRILPHLVGLSERDQRHLTAVARTIAVFAFALALIGGLAGWFLGPTIVKILYREGFAPTAAVAMLAAYGVMVAAGAQILSQVLVAEGRTSRLSWAWAGGLAVAVLFIVLGGGDADLRVASAFAAGETAAFGLMAVLSSRR